MNNHDLITRLHETSQALEQLAQHLSEMEQTDIAAGSPAEENSLAEPADKDEPKDEPEPKAENKLETSSADIIDSDPNAETGSLIIETTFEPIEEDASDNSVKEKAQSKSAKQNNNNPFAKIVNNLLSKPLPNAGNPGGFNLLQIPGLNSLNGLGGLPGLNGQSLPTTLAELHDNPQLLGLLKNVSDNPQMLNMLSSLIGQDSQTLLQTLQNLQPASAQAAQTAAAAQTAQPAANAVNPPATPAMQSPQAAAIPASAALSTPGELPATPYLDSLLAEWRWQPLARVWNSLSY